MLFDIIIRSAGSLLASFARPIIGSRRPRLGGSGVALRAVPVPCFYGTSCVHLRAVLRAGHDADGITGKSRKLQIQGDLL